MAIVDIDQIRTSHSLGARGLRRVAPHIMAMQAPKLYEATLGHPEEAFRRTMLDIDDMPCGRCSPDLDTCPRGHYRTFRTGHGQCETQACEACGGTGTMPRIILSEIVRCFPDKALDIISRLRFSGSHYSFTLCGMYVGVEFDGHIHS